MSSVSKMSVHNKASCLFVFLALLVSWYVPPFPLYPTHRLPVSRTLCSPLVFLPAHQTSFSVYFVLYSRFGVAFAESESILSKLQRGSTFTNTKSAPNLSTGPGPASASASPYMPANAAPAPHMPLLPDLSEDDIFSFLEQARVLTGRKQPVPAANADADAGASFAESGASAKAGVKDGGAPPVAPWMYMNTMDPPLWLRFNLSSVSGMPTTRPPPVPAMLPPPPPVMFPEFSYTRPMQGPYAPARTAVPAYSMSSPPPVPAAQWIPLSAYIQPPGDSPNPELVEMTRDAVANENAAAGKF